MNTHPLTFFSKYRISPRPQQLDILNELKIEWNNYKYFAISAPTGVGKSYIATSIASTLESTYILTSSLQLQDQYEKSWEEIVSLKGRGNYTCNLNTNFTVDAAPCTANSSLMSDCRRNFICEYYNQKARALEAQAMITNPVYLLYSAHCGFAKDEDSEWVKRDLMIIDEAHNLEKSLVSFAESEIDLLKYQEDYGLDISKFEFSNDDISNYYIIVELKKALEEKAEVLAQQLEAIFKEIPKSSSNKEWAKNFTKKISDKVAKLNAKIYSLDKAIQPLKIFFNTHNTADELSTRWMLKKYADRNAIKLAPIYGDFLFQLYFGALADKFVFLSATLGGKEEFIKEIGIASDKCLYIETDSPFPPEKSPIIVIPSINLSKDKYEKNIKKVGNLIDSILESHPGQRGVIHSTTYDIARNLFNDVSSDQRKRLLTRDMHILNGEQGNKVSNQELLEMHDEGYDIGTVLVSPSMFEGIDLHDELSEFQIIIKLPWANLGDARVRTKMNIDDNWYKHQMWLTVLQASGRSTRHEEDSSITYILDEMFMYHYNAWKHKLPSWFTKRIIF